MGDSYLGMLHNDPYSDYNYYGSQVYVPAESPGPSTVQFVHPYANRPNTHSYANHPSQPSACTSYITTDEIESMTKLRIQEQTRAEKGAKVQRNKRQSTSRLVDTCGVSQHLHDTCVSQCAHAWQIKNLAETNFVEIFGRTKQILSVQCVRTQSEYSEFKF